ncbi:unnamed protein product [Caenorhabditis angaria]|uniref:Serpentine Receptor, class H n=1 Tax=Caenorhabditis angaria TaxID=860376 RepID=A0A9P1ITM1_9PELO|nr:unnamed protein product [Caenorhabditis angaria]
MYNMRITMLNTHVWSTISDLVIGTLTIPYLFFPAIAGTPLGFFNYFEISPFIQTYIATCCIAEVGSSIVLLFENRYFYAVSEKYRINNPIYRNLFTIINCSIAFLFIIPLYFNIPDQILSKFLIIISYECLSNVINTHQITILTMDPKIVGILFIFITVFLFGQCIFFFVYSAISLYISSKNTILSERTKYLQRKYFISVCIQISVPMLLVVLPVYYFTFSIIMDYYNQDLNNLSFMIISMHGFVSTITTIFIYDHYRNYTFNLFSCRKDRRTSIISLKTIGETTFVR